MAKLLVDSDDRFFVTLIVIPSQFSGDVSSSNTSSGCLCYCFLPTGNHSTKQIFISSYIESHKPHIRTVVSELARDIWTHSELPRRRRLAGIVVDMFCTLMIDVADEFGLPAYIFYTSNASFLGLHFHVQPLYDEKKLDVSELKDSYADFDVPTLTRSFPAKCLPSMMLSKESFPNVLRRARSLRGTKSILVNSVAEMEPQVLKFFFGGNKNTPPVYAVGPVLEFKTDVNDSSDGKRKKFWWWLDEKPPSSVVFLCFGSMGGFSEEQTREIAVALERSSHRFLWSLRRSSPEMVFEGYPPGEFKNLEEILPEGFLDRMAEIGRIIGWAPQLAVLESPVIGAFVTHCGWNSILESLWFGVPTAGWPIYAEQEFKAFQMVEELGLTAEIRKDFQRDSLSREPEMVMAEEIERDQVRDGAVLIPDDMSQLVVRTESFLL